jgi:hypothetical protein
MSTKKLSDDPEGTIPVDQAIELALNWRVFLDESGQDFITESFLIPIIAFQNILKYNPEADSVRAYIGLSDPADPTSSQLLLVPVVGGQDKTYLTDDKKREHAKDAPSNVYDYTTPCPPVCPVTGSPLGR